MSGLVVKPGDTLVLPIDARVNPMSASTVEGMRRTAEAQFPGVTVVFIQGLTGSAFVYRPDKAASEKPDTPAVSAWGAC